tara:strand:- start:172 stop:471 length:300 start_codon:yes stop_codon:yes gene_type:complete
MKHLEIHTEGLDLLGQIQGIVIPLEPALKMITITLEETLIDHTKDQTITWVTLDQTIRLIQAQEVLQEVLDLALDLQMVFLDHQHLVQQEQEKLIKCQN